MTPERILQEIGLSDKEIAVYLANLEIGTAASSIIARKAGVARTTGYSLLCELQKKGFVNMYEKAAVKYFTAISADELVELMNHRCRQMQHKTDLLKRALPIFHALHTAPVKPPKVQYFEGLEGIKQIYTDTLRSDIVEKLAYSSAPDTTGKLKQFLSDYVKKRTALDISVRAIFQDTPSAHAYTQNDVNVKRTSRFADLTQFQFKSEINIYGDKIALVSLVEPHYHGVIIQSPEIAETQKAIFELAWKGADKKFVSK